jgi:hypothetical protein
MISILPQISLTHKILEEEPHSNLPDLSFKVSRMDTFADPSILGSKV